MRSQEKELIFLKDEFLLEKVKNSEDMKTLLGEIYELKQNMYI